MLRLFSYRIKLHLPRFAAHVKSYLGSFTQRAFDMKSCAEVPLQALMRIDQADS